MNFTITDNEKTKAIEHTDDIASLLVNTQDGVYYKIFSIFLQKYKSNNIEDCTLQKSVMISNLSEMIKNAVREVSNENEKLSYTTGELSKYFGVSITSINNWVKEGRFIGVRRSSRNRHVRISEDTMWRSLNGNVLVKDIVDQWKSQYSKIPSENEEKKALQKDIKFYVDKYGEYEYALKIKEQVPASELLEWEYLLNRLSK